MSVSVLVWHSCCCQTKEEEAIYTWLKAPGHSLRTIAFQKVHMKREAKSIYRNTQGTLSMFTNFPDELINTIGHPSRNFELVQKTNFILYHFCSSLTSTHRLHQPRSQVPSHSSSSTQCHHRQPGVA